MKLHASNLFRQQALINGEWVWMPYTPHLINNL